MINKYFSRLLFITVLILTIVLFSCNRKVEQVESIKINYKIELQKETWITNQILGLDTNVQKYIFTKFIKRKFIGNLTTFSDKKNFTSKFVSPCGNDYLSTVYGKYLFSDKDKIKVAVDSVIYSGIKEKPNQYRLPLFVEYVITKTQNSIILTRIN